MQWPMAPVDSPWVPAGPRFPYESRTHGDVIAVTFTAPPRHPICWMDAADCRRGGGRWSHKEASMTDRNDREKEPRIDRLPPFAGSPAAFAPMPVSKPAAGLL